MKPQNILLYTCLSVSTASLGAGYLLAGNWKIFFVFPVLITICLIVKRYDVFWSASIYLAVYVLLAANGILAELPLPLMLVTGTTAMAGWELMQSIQRLDKKSLQRTQNLLEKNHQKALGPAAASGLALAQVSSFLSFELPFIVFIILAVMIFAGLHYGLRQILQDRP
ncbi:MAG: hypothetical protein JXA25_11030 [Anaerolineales bacterium]|nr:hypothetical protein [Anaerolineales bacterium]